MKKKQDIEITDIWKKYERGKDHHNRLNLYYDTHKAFNFYEGNQWAEISNANPEELPTYNIIRPTVDYKATMISKRKLNISFAPQGVDTDPDIKKICDALGNSVRANWESINFDALHWRIGLDACIAGDSYLYFYDGDPLSAQIVDNTSIYLADEQQEDIQKQRYIILHERRPVCDVRRDATNNKISKKDIDLILPDQDTETVVGEKDYDTDLEDGKCSCLVYITRNDEDGYIHISRSTKSVIYQEDTPITGLKKYPIVPFVWLRKKNSARGIGEVKHLIPNNIETNRLLIRRIISAKLNAFAKPVYAENLIENPEDVESVGKSIKVKTGSVSRVKDVFDYVAPAPMSQEASLLQDHLLNTTRELSGSGDAALGNINPERASGAAIIALQDQAAIPLNRQMAEDDAFVENCALVTISVLQAYNPDGLKIRSELEDGTIQEDVIKDFDDIKLKVRVDASPTTPFSKYAQEQALENTLANKHITFEEYVDALPNDAVAPKSKFAEIVNKRAVLGIPSPDATGGLTPSQAGNKAPKTLLPTRGGL